MEDFDWEKRGPQTKLVDNFTAKYYMMDRTIHKKKYLPSHDGSSNCTHILMEMNEKQDYHY